MMTERDRGTPTIRPPLPAGTIPPGIIQAAVGSCFGLYDAYVRNAGSYYASLVSGHATPLDVAGDLLAWTTQIAGRERPTWTTPHTIVTEWPVARLRDFSTGQAPKGAVPVLILPPQAGHDSCIVDFAANQSQVHTALDAGLGRVFSLDWIGATQATKDATVEDYMAVIRETVERLGGTVHLVGDCQGGWLAVIYAALHPEDVETLTIAGAPVDFHAGEPQIHDWMQMLSPMGGMEFYRGLVALNDGVLPGNHLLTGFKIMQPEGEVGRQLQLLARINDPVQVERYRLFENWFQYTQPIPGAFYLWIVERLFMNNELLKGELEVGGARVDLGRIHCPLYLLTGAKDHITPPPQVFALANSASTPESQITRLTAPGGHLGLFMGRAALDEHWSPLFKDLARRGTLGRQD